MEKRSVERFDLHVPATVFVEGGSLQEVLSLETENVSSAGTFLRTDKPVPEGVNVEVHLYLPLERWLALLTPHGKVCVTVRGTVVRAQPDGVAVAFDGNYRIESFGPEADEATRH